MTPKANKKLGIPILTNKERGYIWACGEGTLTAICEAQRDDAVRRIVGWGNEPCIHSHKDKEGHLLRYIKRECDLCWEELERMVK